MENNEEQKSSWTKPNVGTNAFILGFIVPCAFTMLVCLVLKSLFKNSVSNEFDYIPTTFFFALPFLIGLIAAFFWREFKISIGKTFLYAFFLLIAAIFFCMFILMEGTICLLILSPVLYSMIVIGLFTGRGIFKRKNNVLRLSLGGLFLFSIAMDVFSPHVYENMVTDEITIHASPEKVWQYVAAYDEITEAPDYWLFKLGMPAPIQSTASGFYKGADRKCIFKNGLVFEEKITVFNPGKDLTFEITKMPKDPEILGHIEILRGQFLLKKNADGSTTLTGNSWYRMHVFPAWYYNLWAESITSNVHKRVMKHIKMLAEKNS